MNNIYTVGFKGVLYCIDILVKVEDPILDDHVCVCVYIYIYIYIVYVCIYIYVYVCICMYAYM